MVAILSARRAGFALLCTAAMLCFTVPAPVSAAEGPVRAFELAASGAPARSAPRVLRVTQNDVVELRITSDVAGEIHLHGYRKEAKVAAGGVAKLAFKAHATGRYRVEWHPAGEDASAASHHRPPLAVLEVHPK